jgi:hypothetical protein
LILDALNIGVHLCHDNLLKTGDAVAIILPPGIDFIKSMIGCIYAGIIAVPISPPLPNQNLSQTIQTIGNIFKGIKKSPFLRTTRLWSQVLYYNLPHHDFDKVNIVIPRS